MISSVTTEPTVELDHNGCARAVADLFGATKP
jgi:hypothetical protein